MSVGSVPVGLCGCGALSGRALSIHGFGYPGQGTSLNLYPMVWGVTGESKGGKRGIELLSRGPWSKAVLPGGDWGWNLGSSSHCTVSRESRWDVWPRSSAWGCRGNPCAGPPRASQHLPWSVILDTSSRTQLRVFSFSSETSHSVLFIPFPPVAHFLDFAALGSSYDFLLHLLWFVFYTRFLCRYGRLWERAMEWRGWETKGEWGAEK